MAIICVTISQAEGIMDIQAELGSAQRLVFGPFEYEESSGLLRKHGTRLRLQGQPLRVLAALLERPGQIVSREEFQQQLWQSSTFVDFEHGLNAAVNRLRQVLGDSAEQPLYIETVAGRGYRFVAPVAVTPASSAMRIAPAPVGGQPQSPINPAMRRVLLIGIAAALTLGLLVGYVAGRLRPRVIVAPPLAELLVGTWKLNAEQSEFDPNHRPAAAIIVFELDSGGYYVMKASGIDQNGKRVVERPIKFIPDGKEHPVPDLPGLKAVCTQAGPRTIQTQITREDGSIVGGGSYVVSADGKSLTATVFGYDSQLRQFKQRMVLDRQ